MCSPSSDPKADNFKASGVCGCERLQTLRLRDGFTYVCLCLCLCLCLCFCVGTFSNVFTVWYNTQMARITHDYDWQTDKKANRLMFKGSNPGFAGNWVNGRSTRSMLKKSSKIPTEKLKTEDSNYFQFNSVWLFNLLFCLELNIDFWHYSIILNSPFQKIKFLINFYWCSLAEYRQWKWNRNKEYSNSKNNICVTKISQNWVNRFLRKNRLVFYNEIIIAFGRELYQ